jgi:hypothetical protein
MPSEGRLRAHAVEELPDLLAAAQELNPAINPGDIVWSIWRLESYRLRQNLLAGFL